MDKTYDYRQSNFAVLQITFWLYIFPSLKSFVEL